MKIKVENAVTLEEAAKNNTHPFIWFPESQRDQMGKYIPRLRSEYLEKKIPILVRACGLGGVYPGESSWLFLKFEDTWIRKYFPEVIAISEVLPEIEHKHIAWHPGCIGDIIASLPILRQVGGAHIVITNFKEERWQNRNMEGSRFDSIRPLLENQPYIKSVVFQKDEPKEWTLDFANWRVKHTKQQTLTESQAEWLGLGKVSMEPWLTVNPSTESRERVIVARSHRYRNPRFPWHGIHGHYKNKLLFIGIPEEHQDFESLIGKIEYRPTRDLLEAAELIAGSALFIGNQSSPCWIAMGLGHQLIQEVSPDVQDSMVFREGQFFTDDSGNKIPLSQFPLQDSQTCDIMLPKIK